MNEDKSSERLWRCIKCGCDYVSEVPHCGALNCGGDVVEAVMSEPLTMNEDEFRGRNEAGAKPIFEDKFSLEKAMANGGKCQIWHEDGGGFLCNGIVALTDFLAQGKDMLLVRYLEEGDISEHTLLCQQDGSRYAGPYYLRNLPEYQEVEVTLWTSPVGNRRVTVPHERDRLVREGYAPFGPPVKVKFPKG